MTTVSHSTFIIFRDDRAFDPQRKVSEVLTIGRDRDCNVYLNHPDVSPLHAGINRVGSHFYLTNLSPSDPTILNGQAVAFKAFEVLIEGDEAKIGPFFLRVGKIEPGTQTLTLTVRLQMALSIKASIPTHKLERYEQQRAQKKASGPIQLPPPSLDIFWEARTGEKAARPSPLHPRTVRSGKARYNWIPTRDLLRPWPVAIFIWAAVFIAAFSTFAAFAHKITFAPGAISDPHARNAFALTPAIAKTPLASSCTSCHALGISVANRAKMNANCETCHQTESFVASIITAHRDAGLTCTSCHDEHRGKNFRPIREALQGCTKCHSDVNKKTYNGKSVHTPHGGTFGYPALNGVWLWKGLDAEELKQKPEVMKFLTENRLSESDVQQWRNAQFHGLHLHRVKVVAGIDGIEAEDGSGKVLSCISCHKTGWTGKNVDRKSPRTTCGLCHNTQVFSESSLLPGAAQPSCTSCHVQHVRDTHWASNLLVVQASPVSSK
jgi:FHA domain-containing protein